MKRLFLILSLLTLPAAAQFTAVTATVPALANATYIVDFIGMNTTPGAGPYLLAGISVFPTQLTGAFTGSGVLNVSLADNNQVLPLPSQWRFNICQVVATPPSPICFNLQLTITGTNQNITTQIDAVLPPIPSPGTNSVLLNPTATQTITQPANTDFNINTAGTGAVYHDGNALLDVTTGVQYNSNGPQTVTQPINTNFNFITSGTGALENNGNKVLDSTTGVRTSPTGSQTITQPSGTTLQVNSLNDVLNPTLFSGTDLGAQINSAVAACASSTNCTIAIPSGTYNLATIINLTGKNIHLLGPGAVIVASSGAIVGGIMMYIAGTNNSVEGVTFNLNDVANEAINVSGANVSIINNHFVGQGSYGIYCYYAGTGLLISGNTFNADPTSGIGMGPIEVQFTSHYRIIGNHMNNTLGFGISTVGGSHGTIIGNDFYQPAFVNTVIAGTSQTSFTFTLPSYATRLGAKVNGVTTALQSQTNTSGNTWTAVFPSAVPNGATVVFQGWQSLEDIQINSFSMDNTVQGNLIDGSGDAGIDVVSDYHATTLSTATATNNQSLFTFTGVVTFFPGVLINGKVLTGKDFTTSQGPVNTGGNNWSVSLVTPQPVGTVVTFANITIGGSVSADYPSQVTISGNDVSRVSATGIGVEVGASNVMIQGNSIRDCAQGSADASFSSGIFAANSIGSVIKNNSIVNTSTPATMNAGISLNYTTQDNGAMLKNVVVGGNIFSGSFIAKTFIPAQSPSQRQTGIDVEGQNIPYPETVNTDSPWTTNPTTTNYIVYTPNGITLTRDTTNIMGGVASIAYPGNGGIGTNYVQIQPAAWDLFGSNSILHVTWWAKVTSGTIGVQLWSQAGGSFQPYEIDASGSGWKQYSIYLATNGLQLSAGVFIRLVGSGSGNFQNITFSSTPLGNDGATITNNTGTGVNPPFTGSCASTTTLTVLNGKIINCI